MKVVALIPAKSLDDAKSRLAPSLGAAERATIALDMLRKVVSAAMETAAISTVAVVSTDDRALAAAYELGAQRIPEHGHGLNHALYLGRRWAIEQACADALLIVLSDLPWLHTSDLSELVLLGDQAPVVIAPSKDGGTNALLLRPPDAIPFRFGPDSAAKHAFEARQRELATELYHSPTLAFDVDTPQDVQAAAGAHPPLVR